VDNLRTVERALDELKRGYAVCLRDGNATLRVMAAEYAGAQPGPLRVVLSGQRANYLGLGAQAISVKIPVGDGTLLQSLLYAPCVETTIQATPASSGERMALGLIKQAGFLPAALISAPDNSAALEVSAEAAEAYLKRPVVLALDTLVRLPVAAYEDTRVATFEERGGAVHLALLIGHPENEAAPLARLHSSCFTGEILESLRCDCGSQLREAIEVMAKAGGGVLLYLNQEGRGIGLINKLRAYHLQEQGLDTVEANLALGFAEDERDFAIAAQMLRILKIGKIRLLTNNPHKVEALTQAGIAVAERVPLVVKPGEHNRDYLAAKAKKMGHRH